MYQSAPTSTSSIFFRETAAGCNEQAQKMAGGAAMKRCSQPNAEFRIEDAYLTAQTSYKLMKAYLDTVIPRRI